MSDRSDFSELYHSGTAKGSKSLDPCVGKKNADCVGSCHLEVSEYKPNELKHISRDQQMENLQLYGSKKIRGVACRSRYGRNTAARSRDKEVSVRAKRQKPSYSGSEYCPQYAGRYAGGGKDACEAAKRPDGRSCQWVKKGRKCRVKAQKKTYDSRYKDSECNPLAKKRDCTGKFGKNLGCRWYKSRKDGKSKKMLEDYGKMGCWSADASRYGGEASSMAAAEKLLASDFVVPAGSCQGLAVSANSVNDAYHKCYERPYCKITKKSKNGGNKLNNLRCVEIPGSYAKRRGAVFSKLAGIGMNRKGLASKISGSFATLPAELKKSAGASGASGAEPVKAEGGGETAQSVSSFNNKHRRSRKSRKSRKSRRRSRKSRRRSRKSRRRSHKSRRRRRSHKSRRRRRSRKSRRRSRKSRRRSRKSRKSRKHRRRSRRSRRSRRGKRKSKCRSCSKKKSCGRSKKFKNCSWRKRVGCVKKSRKHRFGDDLH